MRSAGANDVQHPDHRTVSHVEQRDDHRNLLSIACSAYLPSQARSSSVAPIRTGGKARRNRQAEGTVLGRGFLAWCDPGVAVAATASDAELHDAPPPYQPAADVTVLPRNGRVLARELRETALACTTPTNEAKSC